MRSTVHISVSRLPLSLHELITRAAKCLARSVYVQVGACVSFSNINYCFFSLIKWKTTNGTQYNKYIYHGLTMFFSSHVCKRQTSDINERVEFVADPRPHPSAMFCKNQLSKLCVPADAHLGQQQHLSWEHVLETCVDVATQQTSKPLGNIMGKWEGVIGSPSIVSSILQMSAQLMYLFMVPSKWRSWDPALMCCSLMTLLWSVFARIPASRRLAGFPICLLDRSAVDCPLQAWEWLLASCGMGCPPATKMLLFYRTPFLIIA